MHWVFRLLFCLITETYEEMIATSIVHRKDDREGV